MYPLSEQQQKALDLKRNIAVIAGAGSGKTTILVNRYLHILLENPQLSVKNILAITFTEKATAEMKERIFRLIENRFHQKRSQQNRLFEIAVMQAREFFFYVGGIIGYFRINVNDEFPSQMGFITLVTSEGKIGILGQPPRPSSYPLHSNDQGQ